MEDISALIQKSQHGDKRAREILIEENLGLVHHIVKRFQGRGLEYEDLFQIGCVGLMKAVDKFNLEYQVAFSTYAVPMIVGEIKRFIRDDGRIKISRTIKEHAVVLQRQREEYLKLHGEEPTFQELAELTGLSMEDVVLSMEAFLEIQSLDQPIFMEDHGAVCLGDRVEWKSQEPDIIDKVLLTQLLEELSEEERKMIQLRFFEDKTQAQVARLLGTSQVQISRMEKRTIKKMRQKLI